LSEYCYKSLYAEDVKVVLLCCMHYWAWSSCSGT